MAYLLEKIEVALVRQKKANRITQCAEIVSMRDNRFVLFEGVGKRTYVVASEEEVSDGADFLIVHIANPQNQIGFAAIDHCLIKDGDSPKRQRCDAALFWNEVVALLDLKLETGKNRMDQTKPIAPGLKTFDSFHDQMKSTIVYFQDYLNIPLNAYELRLYVVFPTATITTTMEAERFGFENDISDIFGLTVTYFLVPDIPSESLSPELWL